MLNWSWITHQLAVGGRLPTGCSDALAAHGIRRVIDLRIEDRDDETFLWQCGAEFLHLPTRDNCAVSPDMLWKGVNWAHQGLRQGHRVLVHCEHGIGRSALLACCILVSFGDTPAEALLRAKNAREQVSPSPEQLHAFLQWARDWRTEQGLPGHSASWDELAAIAYRHLKRA